MQNMTKIKVGEYLFHRVKELGVESIFGVPGDYELALLDLVEPCGLSWKGNANELVAGYAADGYARVKGVGCLITTFGPGELSALNAISGSYAEKLPIIHIVGYPAMQAITGKMTIHHTLGNGNYTAYHEMSKHITCADTVLTDLSTVTSEIDRVLNAAIQHSQPVYIGVPGDIGQAVIEAIPNLQPLSVELPTHRSSEEKRVLEVMSHKVSSIQRPVAIIDAGVLRSKSLEGVMAFVEKYNIPFVETSMSKGAINERHNLFGGHYPGLGTNKETRTLIKDSDCIFWFGPFINDLNTPGAESDIRGKVVMMFHRTHIEIDGQEYQVDMKAILNVLTKKSDALPLQTTQALRVPTKPFPDVTPPEGDVIKSDWLMSYVTHLLRPGDVFLTETGTAGINIRRAYFPENIIHITQKLWGSIGYATGAALGSFIAANEIGPPKHKRNILFTGEGSFQMTAQAFGDYSRYNTNGYIFIINNSGYTIERAIHGANATYNDVASWNYQLLPQFFDSTGSHPFRTYQIHTPQQFHDLLFNDPDFRVPDKLRVIEIFTGKHDYGEVLHAAGPAGDRFNLGGIGREEFKEEKKKSR
ncbi:putative pyruvate decarboxylase [Phaeomoniella chlamydospora]|uniref:Pyruvate decarboxylase n=1 Tax=Phaeomoniella chlamydospora TaxID=158046 RepID=A0A0G2EKB2_PHACM|nr:putative pyruvate decarboxylase [Phaeomoniella chlamydospora]